MQKRTGEHRSVYWTDSSAKAGIDAVLDINARIRPTLGADSTEEELYMADVLWERVFLPKIREVDPVFAEVFNCDRKYLS